MASSCQWSARPPCCVQRHCDPILPDLEVHVWAGPSSSNEPGREPDQAGPAGLGRARLQHPVAAPEDAECGHRSAPQQHGADYRQQWRKVHLGIDAQTLEIRAIEITDNAIGDAPMLPELLAQIPEDEPLHSVSADGAYDTKACHEAIASRQAAAIIPTRKNAKPWADDKAGAQARNEILRATRRLGRSIWKKWSGYHRRSLVETKWDASRD